MTRREFPAKVCVAAFKRAGGDCEGQAPRGETSRGEAERVADARITGERAVEEVQRGGREAMSDKAVIQGSFADYRLVKGRKVLQLVIEVPAEMAQAAFERLGIPTGAEEFPVAVARLAVNETPFRAPQAALPSPDEPQAGKRKWSDLTPAQQAGIRCNEPAFQKWLGALGPNDAADRIRRECNVTTRAALNTDPDAAMRWRGIDAEYSAWLNGYVE